MTHETDHKSIEDLDVDLNKELLKAGLAWHYKHYSSVAWPHTGFK
jgi:hypothetical protein